MTQYTPLCLFTKLPTGKENWNLEHRINQQPFFGLLSLQRSLGIFKKWLLWFFTIKSKHKEQLTEQLYSLKFKANLANFQQPNFFSDRISHSLKMQQYIVIFYFAVKTWTNLTNSQVAISEKMLQVILILRCIFNSNLIL